MPVLEELEEAASAVAARVAPAVVRVGRQSRGAGVVVGDGLVATNAHNLRGAEVTVTFADGRSVVGAVRGVDVDGDLAVVGVDTAGAPALEFGTPAQPGRVVFGIAPGPSGVRVTFGLVSSVGRPFRGPRGRRIAASVEHTAPLPRGSSGGPVVDAQGRMIGLNTLRLDGGFYLALPADDTLRARIDALAQGESPQRRTLGLGLAPSQAARQMRAAVGLEPRDGLLVRQVAEGSPAEAAGIRPGDLVVGVDGRDVTTADDLHAALDSAGESLTIQLVRGAEELEVTVQFT